VIDLRPAVETDLVRVPRSERIPEPLDAARFRPDETVVLVSEDGGGPAARDWARLRAQGHRQVVVLHGGADRWVDDVLSPTLPAEAPPEDVAAFRRVSELSRYFGGVPRVLAPGEAAPRPAGGAARHAIVRGRGC
jgi:3-mercaptopyruvate sulfurtransferase SseA